MITDMIHYSSAFVHKKDCESKDLVVGQPVSFVFEEGPKGASAKNVKEEGEVAVAEEEDGGDRELGKVKSYNEEKGFAFIVSTIVALEPSPTSCIMEDFC